MKTPLLSRVRYAFRYLVSAELPPNPADNANLIMWATLGRTGDWDAAYAARDAELALVGGAR